MADFHRNTIIIISIVVSIGIISASAVGAVYSRSSIWFRNKCSDISTQTPCETAGCYWWDDSCHPYSQIAEECYILDDEITLCVTNLNTQYLIINTGFYGVVIDV